MAQPQQGGSFYLVPQGGAIQTQNNGVELITGAMLDYYVPENKSPVLDQTTNEFLKALEKGDANMRNDPPSRTTLAGKPALMTKLTTRTSQGSDPAQTIYLYTVARESGLWYLVLAAPTSRIASLDAPFREIAQSVQFNEN